MAWNDGLEEGTPAHTLASTLSPIIRAVAGPGSGKSFAIKRRVARLLENNVPGASILAITFTRTAAQDLKREISSIGIPEADEVHARTLHSHALKILMQAETLQRTGRKPRMVIDHEITPALKDLENEKYGGVKKMKELLQQYLAAWASLQTDTPGYVNDEIQSSFEEELINWLKEHEGTLVGEVIPIAIEFLRHNPASPEIGKYAAILVDEYQDLNKSEQEFIHLLKGDADIVIVGDDDQSIYGFKYAHPEGIREIDKMYGDFQDIPFAECRRCPKQVTRMASELISKNPARTLGELAAHANNSEGVVNIIQWNNYDDEIDGISKVIINEIQKGLVRPEDVLVLAPRRRIGYRLRDYLLTAGIPVRSYFRESAITKDSVRRAYSLLNLLANPSDAISLRFVLGAGSADFRRNGYSAVKKYAKDKAISISNALNTLLKEKDPDKSFRIILSEYRKILEDLATLRKNIQDDPTGGIEGFFVKTSEDEIEFYELVQLYKKAAEEVGVEKLADQELFDEWLRSVFGIIQETIALPEVPDEIEHVRIMSLHSSKGLSAKFVILCSMIDHLIPFIPNDESAKKVQELIEEQRRLFYVAITRCKASEEYPGRLIISSFLSIAGIDALRMGLDAKPRQTLRVSSTRFLKEFGTTAPPAVAGKNLQ